MLAHERLGFKTYNDYLNSDLWRTIRSRVFDRDGYACRDCGVLEEPIVVHHTSYALDVLEGRDDRCLVTLCHPCHRRRHHHLQGDYLPFIHVEPVVSPPTSRPSMTPRLITPNVLAERQAKRQATLGTLRESDSVAHGTTDTPPTPITETPPTKRQRRAAARAKARQVEQMRPRRGLVIAPSSPYLKDSANWSSRQSGSGRRRQRAQSYAPVED